MVDKLELGSGQKEVHLLKMGHSLTVECERITAQWMHKRMHEDMTK